ncbi:MAG: thermonuclease family protein [Proteobacteria bacterium]|nr:thermonuclease family protein [Pseudomonadota bacterium]
MYKRLILCSLFLMAGPAMAQSPVVEPVHQELTIEKTKQYGAPALCKKSPNKGVRIFPMGLRRVVDGDTIDVTVDLGFEIVRNIRVRLLGADTPETFCKRGVNPEACGAQKAAADAATEYAKNWLTDAGPQGLEFRYTGDGKYGRPLGYICSQGTCLNYELIFKKHATYYCGGPR